MSKTLQSEGIPLATKRGRALTDRSGVPTPEAQPRKTVPAAEGTEPDAVMARGEAARRQMLAEHGAEIVQAYLDTTRAEIERGVVITVFDMSDRDAGVRQVMGGEARRGVSDVRVFRAAWGGFRMLFRDELPAWIAEALATPAPIPGLVVCLAGGGATGGRLVHRPRLRQWVLVPSTDGRPRAGGVIPVAAAWTETGRRP